MCNTKGVDPAKWNCIIAPNSKVECEPPADDLCLKALCQPATGECELEAINEGATCDDGSLCTISDVCIEGECTGQEELECNDGNICTDDSCHPEAGCLAIPIPEGTVCGANNWVCQSGECLPCSPQCVGKDCGADACGGICGTCPGGEYCTGGGQCVPNCTDCAPWQDCVDGACADPQPMGACASGGQMIGLNCFDTPLDGCCAGDDGRDRYYCGYFWDCPNYELYCLCHEKCSWSKVCGWDSWADEYQCEYPPAEPEPGGKLYCDWMPCTPNCLWKECGDDGCGGSCGSCAWNEECQPDGTCCKPDCAWKECGDDGCGGSCGFCDWDEECLSDGSCCAPLCFWSECGDDGCGGSCGTCSWDEVCENGQCVGVVNECGNYTWEGCCDNETLYWCEDGEVKSVDCSSNPECGWDAGNSYYNCGTNGSAEPTGQFPKSCSGGGGDPNGCESDECGDLGGACYCDSACWDYGDCCWNVCQVCGHCG